MTAERTGWRCPHADCEGHLIAYERVAEELPVGETDGDTAALCPTCDTVYTVTLTVEGSG